MGSSLYLLLLLIGMVLFDSNEAMLTFLNYSIVVDINILAVNNKKNAMCNTNDSMSIHKGKEDTETVLSILWHVVLDVFYSLLLGYLVLLSLLLVIIVTFFLSSLVVVLLLIISFVTSILSLLLFQELYYPIVHTGLATNVP